MSRTWRVETERLYEGLPRNVQAFVWLAVAQLVVSFLEIPLMPRSSNTGTLGVALLGVATIIVITLVLLPFFWLTVWRRKN